MDSDLDEDRQSSEINRKAVSLSATILRFVAVILFLQSESLNVGTVFAFAAVPVACYVADGSEPGSSIRRSNRMFTNVLCSVLVVITFACHAPQRTRTCRDECRT